MRVALPVIRAGDPVLACDPINQSYSSSTCTRIVFLEPRCDAITPRLAFAPGPGCERPLPSSGALPGPSLPPLGALGFKYQFLDFHHMWMLFLSQLFLESLAMFQALFQVCG